MLGPLDCLKIEKNWLAITQEFKHFNHNPVLIAVTKTRSMEEILFLYKLGQRHFGENRVEELLPKSLGLKDSCPEIHWHFIGAYQQNKLNKLLTIDAPLCIHSLVTRQHVEKLHKKLNDITSLQKNTNISYFVQVNTSGEEQKSGLEIESDELQELFRIINDYPINSPKFLGLMTMANLITEKRTEKETEMAKNCFLSLASKLALAKIKYPTLCWSSSMGMGQDYQEALMAGSNYVRIGSRLFD